MAAVQPSCIAMETGSQTGILLALPLFAEICHEKPFFYLPSYKQLAEGVSSFSRLLSRDWEGSA